MQNAFLIKFMRSLVGQEDELIKTLEAEVPASKYYKVFGKYDVLEISRFTDLNEAIRGNSDGRILSINAFPCFCWNNEEDEFWSKLDSSVSPVVALLKLQDPVFKKEGLKGLQKVATYLSTFGSSKGYALIGMGYYELLLWLPDINFDEIFKFTSSIRKLRINDVFPSFSEKDGKKGLFADTTTIPIVSYKNVIDKAAWDRLTGKVTPIVKIKTAPGQEDLIIEKWPVGWRQLLGTEDLVFAWNEPVPLAEFVPQLVEFRKNWIKNFAVIDTSTRLIGHEPYELAGQSMAGLPAFEGPLPPIIEKLRDLGKATNANPFVISELINIIGMINANVGNRAQLSTYSDIIHSIAYLNSLLAEYQIVTKANDFSRAASLEDYLLDYTNCIYAAIAQHFPIKDYSEFSTNAIPYAGSLSRIVTAISVLPEQLFQIIAKSTPPQTLAKEGAKPSAAPDLRQSLAEFGMDWQGFLFLNLAEGYKVVDQGEIFYTPYKDIFQVLNWITLSHEISHAYYYRLNFELLENEWLSDIVNALATQKNYSLYEDNIGELCSEFFAHWFDYVHFFNRDLDFYTWSIWRTWVKLPRIHQFKNNYWIRTVFIRVCNKWDDIKPQIQKAFLELDPDDAYLVIFHIITHELEEVESFIKNKFPDEFTTVMPTDEDKEEIASIVLNYHDFIRKFEDNYVNEGIISRVGKTYATMSKDITQILAGTPVTEPINNPFLLIREILRGKFKTNDKTPLPDNATTALIYSLWEASRKFRRKAGL